jgi:hypothetical protein
MKSTMKFYLMVLFSASLFFACGDTEEKPEDNSEDVEVNDVSINVADQLNGSWTSTKVLRSGNETDMGPFTLEYNTDENTFTSNLFDDDGKFPYESGVKAVLNDNSLSFENLANTFQIDSIDEKNLKLSSRIHNYPFEFTFEKK